MSLARTQALSLATKAVTTALGIVQSIIVIRVLGPAEFGLVGLVTSIGGLIGVSQHLGIVDGAIREIAVLKSKAEAAKVFWVSQYVRQAVTLPLSVGLFLLAHVIAGSIYGRPEIAPYIQIFAGILILQGLQDVLGATLTGLKRFSALYSIQIVTAAINIAVFGLLTWQFGATGFFWAIGITTAIMVALLGYATARSFGEHVRLPSRAEIRQYARRVIRIGVYMYAARIFFVVWQRLPLLVLGGVLAADQLGFINVSLTFGSKLTVIAMALAEVNLAWMSSLYAREREKFLAVVQRNMRRVFVVMMGITLVLLFFTPEILRYIVGAEYLPAHDIILIVTAAFFLYSLLDIGTNSVFVSADRPRVRAAIYAIMTAISGAVMGWLLMRQPDPLLAALGVLLGAIVSYVVMLLLIRRQFRLTLLDGQLFLFLLMLVGSVGWLLTQPDLLWRSTVFVLLAVYVLWEARRSRLLPRLGPGRSHNQFRIVCFAGAFFDQPSWTNRQQIMSRVSRQHPVLYVEPRVWLLRFAARHWRTPGKIVALLRRIVWFDEPMPGLFVKSQWNLIPGSREFGAVSLLNHWLNRWNVLLTAWLLGFRGEREVLWLYDTEAAEFLNAWPEATVLYDCVDDHAAQAGVDRNPQRVRTEEQQILHRANVVTTTSARLFEQKKSHNPNTHLVLNAGDVSAFQHPTTTDRLPRLLTHPAGPIIGSVGALDSYKYDFPLLTAVATAHPEWQFVLIGQPVVERPSEELAALSALPNVHLPGAVERSRVPAYVNRFDVCLIPYRDSDYNAASFPLKFWEFMATGKPIVVTGLPELKRYHHLIGYGTSSPEVIDAIKQALAAPQLGSDKRVAEALQHTWEYRTDALVSLLLTAYENRI